jgi:hypothetical protein
VFVAQLEALRSEKLQAARPAPAFSSVPVTCAVWAHAAPSLLPQASRERLIAFAQLSDCTARRPVAGGATFAPVPGLEAACRAIPLALAEAVTLESDAAGQALIATMGDQGLVSFTEHLDLEAALPLASAKAPPRVLVTGFFSRTVTDDLQLDLIAHDLGGGKPLSVTLTKGTPAALLQRAERDLLRQLERAGHLATKAPALARPVATDALLDLVHEVLALVLTKARRVDSQLKWGGGQTVARALELAEQQPQADTPALLALAALDGPEGKARVAAALAARPKLAGLEP